MWNKCINHPDDCFSVLLSELRNLSEQQGAVCSSSCDYMQGIIIWYYIIDLPTPQNGYTHAKNILTLVYIWVLRLSSYTITFSVNSQIEKCKRHLSWSKNSRKVLTADIFIYERTKVLRGSKNVGWIYLLNKGQQNTTTKTRQKHQRSKIF